MVKIIIINITHEHTHTQTKTQAFANPKSTQLDTNLYSESLKLMIPIIQEIVIQWVELWPNKKFKKLKIKNQKSGRKKTHFDQLTLNDYSF